MKSVLLEQIVVFLKRYCHPDLPILLGFSGGADSTALLHLLRECLSEGNQLAIAHIDHGWRSESAAEACAIVEMAKSLSFQCHVKTLEPNMFKGNLEAACREERLNFFKELCATYGYQGVMLAHHADDYIETVLKRTLEGSDITNLGGLQPEAEWNGIKLWRPLLGIHKKDLVSWLKNRQLPWFEDSTNRDPQFLRSRFRIQIIPQLSADFGKEVGKNLLHLGNEAQELKEYLDFRIDPLLNKSKRNSLGLMLDLSLEQLAHTVELKYLIRRICKAENIHLSREQIDLAVDLLQEGAANKQIGGQNKCLFIDRRRLFILNALPKVALEEMPLVEGNMQWGSWQLCIEKRKDQSLKGDWKNLWQEGLSVDIPMGKYVLGNAKSSQSLSKWWTDHKVPAFLRYQLPVLYSQGKLCHEFLSGKTTMPATNDMWTIRIL